ncbi:hypothetical protein [Eubacterium sp.]|uniref:hypothetical protein n=1 Tax=Eubacterium sp. TaxID=142586 RepID=UPI0025EC524A|nr:hypothetical protein [Eubacterium sp.]MCR5629684.1 hypothetical protein [Eubacterium sp.]
MKIFKLKAMVLTLSITVLSTTQISVASEQKNELYITDDFVVDCNKTEALYNSDDNLIAFYFEGEKGYAIVGTDGELIEFSEDCKIDGFDAYNNEKSYYAGMGAYYVETESPDMIKDVCSGEMVTKDDINTVEVESEKVIKKVEDYKGINVDTDRKGVSITYPNGIKDPYGNSTYTTAKYKTLYLQKYGSISHRTRYYDYNRNKTCGSMASSIMMYYYFDHIDSSYIKNNTYKGKNDESQRAFYKHFCGLVGDPGIGSTYDELKNGINKYLGEIGKSKSCKYIKDGDLFTSVSSKIETIIDNKKPCIIGLKNEPKYGNHWTVGGGYARYYGIDGHFRERVYFIKVNNGLEKTREKSIVYVNYKYVDGVLYLD